MNQECLKSIQFDILLSNPQTSSRFTQLILWETDNFYYSPPHNVDSMYKTLVGNYKLTLVAMSQRMIKIAKAPVQEEQSSDRQFSQ